MKVTRFRPKKKIRSRKHGFLRRMRTQSGQATISRRRQKGRKRLTA